MSTSSRTDGLVICVAVRMGSGGLQKSLDNLRCGQYLATSGFVCSQHFPCYVRGMRGTLIAVLLLGLGCRGKPQHVEANSAASPAQSTDAQTGGSTVPDAASDPHGDAMMSIIATSDDDDASVVSGGIDLNAPHHIQKGSCDPTELLPADWPLEPGWSCTAAPGTPTVSQCVSGIECTENEQCDAQPFGRCTGYGKTGCEYNLPDVDCTTDADCTALANGFCTLPFPPGTVCYPNGECRPASGYCYYRELSDPCESDEECSSLPGGYCKKVITHATCQYNTQCETDQDCEQGQRCLCGWSGGLRCMDSDCWSDADCEPGQQCSQASLCGGPGGYYCTTSADECETIDDCNGLGLVCTYEARDGYRRCTEPCTIP